MDKDIQNIIDRLTYMIAELETFEVGFKTQTEAMAYLRMLGFKTV